MTTWIKARCVGGPYSGSFVWANSDKYEVSLSWPPPERPLYSGEKLQSAVYVRDQMKPNVLDFNGMC